MTTAVDLNRVFGLLLIVVGVSDVVIAMGLVPAVAARLSSAARGVLMILGFGLLIVGGLHAFGLVRTV